jgi:probable rRNA maturation factor
MSVTIGISVEAGAWHRILGAELIVHRAVAAALDDAGPGDGPGDGEVDGEVDVLLADDARVRELNRVWRGKDQATNVLSFPASMPAPARLLGDIALAFETVTREAAAEGKTPEAHLTHLAVHGTLHLLGHDHDNDKDAAEMEDREIAILARLGFPDPYAERAEEQSA